LSARDLERAKIVASASDATRKKTKIKVDRQLTLAEQAALVKYSDDKQALSDVRNTIEMRPQQLEHVIARIEDERERESAVKQLKDMLAATKTKVIPEPEWWSGPPEGVEPLMNLTDNGTAYLDLAHHRTCPGHAATIVNTGRRSDGKPSVVWYCTDWKANGHKLAAKPKMTWQGRSNKRSTSAKPVDEKARAKATAERRAVIANNKAWTPATKVRLEWLNQFIKRKTLNPAAKLWVLNEIIVDHDAIVKTGLKASTNVEQSFVIVFGQLAQFREGELSNAKWRPGHNKDRLARYIKFIESQGYALSDVEKLILKAK
jgi:ParB family chromosome partitioning protein